MRRTGRCHLAILRRRHISFVRVQSGGGTTYFSPGHRGANDWHKHQQGGDATRTGCSIAWWSQTCVSSGHRIANGWHARLGATSHQASTRNLSPLLLHRHLLHHLLLLPRRLPSLLVAEQGRTNPAPQRALSPSTPPPWPAQPRRRWLPRRLPSPWCASPS